jgi:hypothetical protein
MRAAVTAGILALICAGGVLAQRTITNADLDKYRVQREAADRDYRENYAKMGFPSPEELRRQLAEDRIANERLVERLSQDRIERERIASEAFRDQQMRESQTVTQPSPEYREYYYNGYGVYGYGYPYPYYPYYGNRYPRRNRQQLPSGSVGGGMYWPNGSPPPPIRQIPPRARPPWR